MESFISYSPDTDFPLQNLPWGVFTCRGDAKKRVGVALGDHVVDVTALQEAGLLSGPNMSGVTSCFGEGSLNAFMGLGKAWWSEARTTLQRLLSRSEGVLRDDQQLRARVILPQVDVAMQLPATVGDYTDFYSSRHHASNVGALFRSPDNALQPNWVHLPVAYHGRSSSIVVSGEGVRRPRGQIKPPTAPTPSFKPCVSLDFELEMGAFIGPGNALGEPISIATARDHVFGYVLLNDWSARDVQAWEYVPLGPFNSKNMVTQISPWVVTLEALEPFTTPPPPQDPEPLLYLHHPTSQGPDTTWDVQLSVDIIPAGHTGAARVTTTNLKHTYWTVDQMVVHHTAGGCNLRPGDLLGTGTLSGPDYHSRACLLEYNNMGKTPLTLSLKDSAPGPTHAAGHAQPQRLGDGQAAADGAAAAAVQRVWLEDGDVVIMRGWCEREGVPRIGFGECRGKVLPCPDYPL